MFYGDQLVTGLSVFRFRY